MKKWKRAVITLSVILTSLVAVVWVYLQLSVQVFEPSLIVHKIELDNCNVDLYLKKFNWGLTGDAQVVVISYDSCKPRSPFDLDSTTQYIFPGLHAFFYKVQADKIVVYTSSPPQTPISFLCEDAVLHIRLKGYEVLDLRDTYEQKGITWLR